MADDKVVDAVEAYIAGLADEEHTLNKLAYVLPNNQICLLSQRLVDTCLAYVGSCQIKASEGEE